MDSSNDGSNILKCSKCQKELNSEVQIGKGGHGLCDDCWGDGICIKKVTDDQNIPLNEYLDRIQIVCKYKTNGCKELLLVSETEDHEKFCYYRNENCYLCKKIFPLQEINKHFKKCSSCNVIRHETSFSEKLTFNCYKPKYNATFYSVRLIKSTQTHFLVRIIDFLEKPTVCVQYLGEDQENAGKYRFDIKINQGLPNSHIIYTGLCVPYIYSVEEAKKQKGLIQLNFESIILDKKFLDDAFELEMTISEVNPPKNDDLSKNDHPPKNIDSPKKPEGCCIIQ